MRIATVDAVKDSVIQCTIAREARGMPLMGKYVVIRLGQELLIGRMGTINLSNPVHEDNAFKPYIMVYGKVPAWSQEVDIEESTVEILGVINDKNEMIARQSNPSSGTDIEDASQEDIERFMNDPLYALTIGTIPNSGGLHSTVINRHFGEWDNGGYGEARHCGIFGQNGSGKTVFALQLMVGKLAAHREMGLLMPDTAGDLSNPTRHNRGEFRWNYMDALKAAGVSVDLIDIGDIRLTSPSTLKQLLQPLLKRHLNMGEEKPASLGTLIVDSMFDDEVDSALLTADAVITEIVNRIASVYAAGGATQRQKVAEAQQLQNDPARRKPFEREFARMRQFFDGREKLQDLIRDILLRGRKVVIRMDTSQGINDREQEYIMRELMARLTRRAQQVYKGEDRSCNAMVVLDEGARWIPEGQKEEGDIGLIVERAFRETRKFGLGWTVISQRMSGVSKEVLAQAHTLWFGRGLGTGADERHLEQQLSKAGVEAYKQLDLQKDYFWVGIGMDANLGTGGTYFAVKSFGGDATKAFIEANPSIFRSRF